MVNSRQDGGGAGQAAELLAREFRRRGHAVDAFVAAHRPDQPHCHRARHWYASRLADWLAARGFPDLGELTSFLWRCHARFAAADVVHLHNLHGNYLSLAALPLWGRLKPLVWTLHDAWALTGNCAYPGECQRWRRACGRCPQLGVYPQAVVDRSGFYRRLKPRLIAAAGPRLVTPSRWLAEQVRGVPQLTRLPLRVIRCATDTEVFHPAADRGAVRQALGLSADAPTVVWTSFDFADPRKGAAEGVAALRLAARRLPGAQLLCVGRHSERVLAASGLPGRACPFVRERPDLARAYACADVCLFPSQTDNLPLTVYEAMACGTPVAAYAVGGVPEQIEHQRTGWLAPGGEPAALAEGLVWLLRRGRGEVGVAARAAVVRTSSPAVVVRAYHEEYRRAMRDWRRRWRRPDARRTPGRLARGVARLLSWTAGSDGCRAAGDLHGGSP